MRQSRTVGGCPGEPFSRCEMITHVVMWKFKEGTEKEQQEFLTGLSALYGVIPQIKSQEIHKSAVDNAEYDWMLISRFDSLEALKTYKEDPRHVKVSTLCKSIRITRSAFDFEEE